MPLQTVTSFSAQENEKLCQVLAGGVNSGARAFRGTQRAPIIVKEGRYGQITDLDDKQYTDFCGSWGALILGHAYPSICEAVAEQMSKGSSYGLSTPLERKLAQSLIQAVESVEMCRFFSSGTEATMTALRLARGYTKRDKFIKFNGNYHGHADPFLVNAGSAVLNIDASASSQGVPANTIEDSISLPYNDVNSLKSFLINHPHLKEQIACIIVEPIAGNMGVVPAQADFLQALREISLQIGALLIFDEVITGLRVGLSGAQGHYQITPDLSTFGKIIGGGFPCAALGGKSEIMNHLAPEGKVFQAGTLSGNPVAMAAGIATMKELETPGFYKSLDQKTADMLRPIESIIFEHQLPIKINRVASMFTIFWGSSTFNRIEDKEKLDPVCFVDYFNFMADNGIFIPPSQFEASFVCHTHTIQQLKQFQNCTLSFIKSRFL